MRDYRKCFRYGLKRPKKPHPYLLDDVALVDACIYLNFFREKRTHLSRLKAIYNGGRNVAAIEAPQLREKMLELFEKCFTVKNGKVLVLTAEEIDFIDSTLTKCPF